MRALHRICHSAELFECSALQSDDLLSVREELCDFSTGVVDKAGTDLADNVGFRD